MENYEKETIAAIATALSDSGIGIVRISGENAIYIVDSIFRSISGKKILTKVQSHTIHYGYIVDKDENIIDEEKGVYNEDGSLNLNPNSLTVLKDCYVEPSLGTAEKYDSFQFVRQGFFCVDAKDSTPDALVFNRIVSLKSSYKLPTQG